MQKTNTFLKKLLEDISTSSLMGGSTKLATTKFGNDDFYARGDSRLPTGRKRCKKKCKKKCNCKKAISEDIDQLIDDAPSGKELQKIIGGNHVVRFQKNIRILDSEDKTKWNFKNILNDLISDIKTTMKYEKSWKFDYNFKNFVDDHEPYFQDVGSVLFIGVVVNDKKELSLVSSIDDRLILTLS